MDLSAEDSLRINVLLANAVAVRIDEGALMVYGLSQDGGEAKIQLNPNCRAEQYVRRIRELLSSHVLGSPGGYPVYLKRWTRMGQTGDARLADLLMLGEPEAVVAVSGAAGLTDELARRVWWSMPDSANARRMLRRESVVKGEMGRVLAEFLIEFLPFEEEAGHIIESVRLVLQPGLIDDKTRLEIWKRGRAKPVFRIGFLQTTPDDLPEPLAARGDHEELQERLADLLEADNPVARQLLRVTSSSGQTFVQACAAALRRPSNQEAVCELLDAIGAYFNDVRVSALHFQDPEQLKAAVADGFARTAATDQAVLKSAQRVLDVAPESRTDIEAMGYLAHVGEPMARPIFSRTDAIGSVMRRKLQPVFEPLNEMLAVLQRS